MQVKTSPIFDLFDQQFDLAKKSFSSLNKQFRSKKAIELEEKIIFLEIYIDLLAKIHFSDKSFKFRLFKPFKALLKNVRKVHHLKLIRTALEYQKSLKLMGYNSYEKHIEAEKKVLYNEVYDQVTATPFGIWEDLYKEAFQYSQDLRPLLINTATTQIINEELEYFRLENNSNLKPKTIKDIHEGLQIIIALENIRMLSGLNPIFVESIHEKMNQLKRSLYLWYQNHLLLQHLSFFLTEKEDVNSKYKQLILDLGTQKSKLTEKVTDQCKYLFKRIL
ncbi:hypothetical protein [Pararhodonellum marinum]|uniref:hypothetical protein n=1 Tax=Pararhodonellum marinum TaxID=2755358 RepID=UPI0018906384|nr:hypothetical protein [Pararhodonellum marinum]